MRPACWFLFWQPPDPSQEAGIQFQPVWRCPASLLLSVLTQQHFLYSLASTVCFAWWWCSPFPSPHAIQDQNGIWIAKHISPVRLKNAVGQEAIMSCFSSVSVLTLGFGQEHEKYTWHHSSRKEENIPVADMRLSHPYTGLFWRLDCNSKIDPLGRRDTVPAPALEGFPAIQLST